MLIEVKIDQAEALRRGFNATSSTARIEVDPARLTSSERSIAAHYLRNGFHLELPTRCPTPTFEGVKETLHNLAISEGVANLNDIGLIGFRGDVAIFHDGSMAVGISSEPLTADLVSPEVQERATEDLRVRLAALPESVSVQFRTVSDNRSVDFANLTQSRRGPIGFQSILDENRDRICEGMQQWSLRTMRTLVFVTWHPKPSSLLSVGRILGSVLQKKAEPRIIPEDEIKEGLSILLNVITDIYTTFNGAISKFTKYLSREDILDEYFRILNPTKWALGGNAKPYLPLSNPRDLVADLSLVFASDEGRQMPQGVLLVDGYYHTMLSVQCKGPAIFPDWGRITLAIPTSEVVICFRLTGRQHAIDRLESSARRGNEQARADIRAICRGDECATVTSQVVHLFAPSLKELDSLVLKVRSLGFCANLVAETKMAKDVWFGILPGATNYAVRAHESEGLGSRLSKRVLIGGTSSGLGKGKSIGAVFETDLGAVINILAPHESHGMEHIFISKCPGRGMMMFANQLLIQLACSVSESRRIPAVMTIANGCQYSKIATLAGGVSVRITAEKFLASPSVVADLKFTPWTSLDLGDLPSDGNAHSLSMVADCSVKLLARVVSGDWGEPNRRKIVVIDSDGLDLESPVSQGLIESAIRSARKHGVRVIFMSTSLNDWAPSIIEQFGHFFLTGGLDPSATRIVGLAPNQAVQLDGCVVKPGEYAQIGYFSEGVYQTLVIHRSPLGYALCTTAPEDMVEINRLTKEGLTPIEAMKEFSRIYPQGVRIDVAETIETPSPMTNPGRTKDPVHPVLRTDG